MTCYTRYFLAALGCYSIGLVALCWPGRNRAGVKILLAAGLALNAVSVYMRYHQAWPMLPMFLGAQTLPLALGLVLLASRPRHRPPFAATVAIIWLTAALAALFPKDYYLPFVKSASWLAHAFFIFAALAKACFLASALWAAAGLWRRMQPDSDSGQAFWWIQVGFGCWTLSLFSGELWSYRGWGLPVVWDDPAITTTMATWFFYACLLHLHLTGTWSRRQRRILAALGGVLVLVINFLPDLGPLRIPL